MTNPAPKISVVIPHLNQPESLALCLSSLNAGQRKPHEIFVVDNGSRTLPTEVCAAHPCVTLLQEPTPGPGPARNAGIAAASGEILAFIDADCIADSIWLAAAEAAMSDPQVTILGGDVRIAYENADHLTALEAYESVYGYRMDRYITHEGFTGTGNLVVRRTVLEDVGPFAGIDVAEDRDWGRRAMIRGYRIRYVRDMKVYTPARKTFAELALKWNRHTAHDYVKARDGDHMPHFLAKTLAMGASPLAEIPRILTSDRLSGPRSRALAFAVLVRIRLYRAVLMMRLLTGTDPDQLSGRWNRA